MKSYFFLERDKSILLYLLPLLTLILLAISSLPISTKMIAVLVVLLCDQLTNILTPILNHWGTRIMVGSRRLSGACNNNNNNKTKQSKKIKKIKKAEEQQKKCTFVAIISTLAQFSIIITRIFGYYSRTDDRPTASFYL